MISYKASIPQASLKVLNALRESNFQAYVVGGAVRDLVIGREPHDFDVATSALPDETRKCMEDFDYRVVIDQGAKHGTITARVDDSNIEITTFRRDGSYSDGRRPDSVEFTSEVSEDAKRRDFTINAMYLDSDGKVVDPVGGLDDIKKRIIRAVGDPVVRFKEDSLRILRALRFSAQLGFEIDPATKRAMSECRGLLKNVSAERIFTEFTGLIIAPYASGVIRDNIDILSEIIPEFELIKGFDQKSPYHYLDVLEHTLLVLDSIPCEDEKRDKALSYAAIIHDMGKPESFFIDNNGVGHMYDHDIVSSRIAQRVAGDLKFSSKLRDEVIELVRFHDYYPKMNRSSVYRFLTEHSADLIDKLIILQKADIGAHSELGMKRMEKLNEFIRIRDEIIAENMPLSISQLPISGRDLIEIGVEPGPIISELLNDAFEKIIQGIIESDKDAVIGYIKSAMK